MVTKVSKGRDTTVPCFCGLSTDSKPTDAGNGAEFKEINTGDTYYYNEAGATWVKWTGGSGGGGGGGGGGSSDLSTATVTCVNLGETILNGAFCGDTEYLQLGDCSRPYSDTEISTLILYKGKAYMWADHHPVSISGNIEAVSEADEWLVTGDCTITFA